MSGELRLVSGNAHPALAESVADDLGVRLVDATIGSFPDGETMVKINDNVDGQDVFWLQLIRQG